MKQPHPFSPEVWAEFEPLQKKYDALYDFVKKLESEEKIVSKNLLTITAQLEAINKALKEYRERMSYLRDKE